MLNGPAIYILQSENKGSKPGRAGAINGIHARQIFTIDKAGKNFSGYGVAASRKLSNE